MRKFKFITDVHEFGCYEIPCEWEYDQDTYYLGDNVDLSCCKPEDVEKAREKLAIHKQVFEGRFVSGNHELEPANCVKVGNVLMTHGDYIFWPKVQADAYRKRKAGMGAAMRSFIWLSVGKILATRNWTISRLMKHRAFKLARKHKCDTIVMGHWHPVTLQDLTYRGVRIIVLPRGKSVMEL